MGDFPTEDGGRYEQIGVVLASTSGVLVQAAATVHVKGAYVELIAATAFDAKAVAIGVIQNAAKFTQLSDLAVGPLGFEVPVVENIFGDYSDADTAPYAGVQFAAHVPAGSRLSVRQQASVANAQVRVTMMLLSRAFAASTPLGRTTSLGVNLATSAGVLIPVGASNVKGAWVEISSSLPNVIKALTIIFGGDQNTGLVGARWLFDIGIGTLGNEVVIIPNLGVAAIGGVKSHVSPVYYDRLPVNIPAGERLVMRSQSNDANPLRAAIYGMD